MIQTKFTIPPEEDMPVDTILATEPDSAQLSQDLKYQDAIFWVYLEYQRREQMRDMSSRERNNRINVKNSKKMDIKCEDKL